MTHILTFIAGCLFDEFKCVSDGECIKSTKIRDGNKDCADGSDERLGRKRVNRVRIDDSFVGDNGVLQRGPSGELKRVNADKVILNYLTRMKFMTTVIRGEHTLFTTRDSTSTSTATSVLDASLLDVLEKSRGIVTESALVHLGIRTKGPTTTIVNLQTDVSIANVQHLKIAPTKPQSIEPKTKRVKYVRKPIYEVQPPTPNIRNLQPDANVANFQPSKIVPSKTQTAESKPTRANYVRKPIYEAPVPSLKKVDVKQLASHPKTYYTQFIYYYTVYDKQNTKKSTRSEIVSTTQTTPETSINIQIDRTVDSDGFISLGSGPETVNLGKRKVGGTTIEVNLAMQSFLRLDGISNVVVETEETKPPEHVFSKNEVPTLVSSQPTAPSTEHPFPSFHLDTSFSSEIAGVSTFATPTIESTLHSENTVLKTRKPIRLSNTDTVRDIVRSRVIVNGRNGSRIRSRPAVNRIENTTPTVDLTPNLIETTPTLESTPSETAVKQSESKVDIPETSSKRPLAVTIRKPFGQGNRFRTRRPAGPIASNEPKFLVVTRSGPVGLVRPTNNRFRIASRVIRPTSSVLPSIEITTTTTTTMTTTETTTTTTTTDQKSVQPQSFSTTYRVNEKGETIAVAPTTVPVIFGLDTSYRTVTLTSTLSPVATAQPSNPKQSSVLVTKFTTSTHTVPFTIGTETFYTKFEITDSTVVTETQPLPSEPSARANKFTKASNGVRIIVSDTKVEPTSAVTLQPTLVTGASVVMKDNIKEQIDDKMFETLTLYTTYTY
ncbi:putative threonine-rich GPI-anchored glycoprotein-like protein, partial [Leptotrombidium deliense]